MTLGGEEEEEEEEEVTEEEEEDEEEELSTSARGDLLLGGGDGVLFVEVDSDFDGLCPGGGRRDSQKVRATRTSILFDGFLGANGMGEERKRK